jgi:hypothetical protein
MKVEAETACCADWHEISSSGKEKRRSAFAKPIEYHHHNSN